MNQLRNAIIASMLITSITLNAQNPAPVAAQQGSLLIINGSIHTGTGVEIENGSVGIENGKIIFVGGENVKVDKSKYGQILDANKKEIYPGFIAMNSSLGLTEIDLVRSTQDFYETGDLNPNVRAVIAYNTDSKIIPTVRSNGVLMAQIVPVGGTITGQSSVVQLDAWNWEDAAYKTDEGIHLNWPRMFVVKSPGADSENVQLEKINKAVDNISNLFREAKAYSLSNDHAEKNLKFEAMRGLFNGTKKLYVHCGFVKEIVTAVNFCKQYGIKMVLVGGDDAWRVTDLLKENNIPVVLGRTHSLPPREDDDVDLPYKLPFLLQQAGVLFAISVDGSWQTRNLPFNAGTGEAYGLTEEQAVDAITSAPAKILGIDATCGTIEVGKDATLIISHEDALDMKENSIETAYIQGREINLDNIQRQLWLKYKLKYGLK